MLVLLSPAKTLDDGRVDYPFHSQPRMLGDSAELVGELRHFDSKSIQNLMGVSVKIADLNVERFHAFRTPFDTVNAKPAALAFKGDVYTGLRFGEFSEEEMVFAQRHIRILSGLYGLLRPMDLMQPYRLEMGTKLSNGRGKNLYEFWGDRITRLINEDLREAGGNAIVNLASNEYFKSVKKKQLEGDLYRVSFKEERGGQYKIISFSAKKARGVMSRYIIEQGITNPEDLKDFAEDGYLFHPGLSSEKDWVFSR